MQSIGMVNDHLTYCFRYKEEIEDILEDPIKKFWNDF
jgi:hypothetical protein